MALNENVVHRIQQQIEMLESSLRHLIPENCTIDIMFSDGGFIDVSAIRWEEAGERPIAKTPRETLLKLYRMEDGSWQPEESELCNEYLAREGLLSRKGDKKYA